MWRNRVRRTVTSRAPWSTPVNGLALTPVISADGPSRRADRPLRSRCGVTVVAVNGIV